MSVAAEITKAAGGAWIDNGIVTVTYFVTLAAPLAAFFTKRMLSPLP